MITCQGSSSRSHGFTLLEVMISISIFATLSILSYAGLNEIQKSQKIIETTMQSLSEIQRALRRFELDVSQQVTRAIYSANRTTVPSFIASDSPYQSLEFTRAGIDPQINRIPSSLMRVGYQYQNETLYRIYWPVLDRSDASLPTRYAVLKNITQLQLIYYDDKKNKHRQWPPANSQQQTAGFTGIKTIEPPIAIELIFTSKTVGKFRKIVPLNNYLHSNLRFQAIKK